MSVADHLSHVKLSGFLRNVNPPCKAAARDVDADERAKAMLVNAVIAVTHDGAVDVV